MNILQIQQAPSAFVPPCTPVGTKRGPAAKAIYIWWLAYVRSTGKPVVVIDLGIGFDASIEIKGHIFSTSVHTYTYLQESTLPSVSSILLGLPVRCNGNRKCIVMTMLRQENYYLVSSLIIVFHDYYLVSKRTSYIIFPGASSNQFLSYNGLSYIYSCK